MAANEIKIIVGGDASGLVDAAKQSKQVLYDLALGTNQSTAAYGKMRDAALAASKGVKTFADDFPEGSIAEAQATVKRLKSEIENLDTTARQSKIGQELGKEFQLATSELKNLEKEAGLANESLGNPLTKAYSGLRQIAYILPGIGVAGIIGALTTGLIDVVKAIAKVDSAENDLANRRIALQSEGTESASKEIAHLQLLYAVATDVTTSYKNRIAAVNELQRTYPEHLGNIAKETILEGKATQAINDTADAILNKALAQAAEDQVAQLGAKRLQNAIDLRNNTEALKDAQLELNKAVAKEGEPSGREGVDTKVLDLQNRVLGITTTIDKLKTEKDRLEAESKQIIEIGKGFAEKTKQTFFDDKTPKVSTKDPVLEALQKRLEVIDKLVSEEGKRPEKNLLIEKLQVEEQIEIIKAKKVGVGPDFLADIQKQFQKKIDDLDPKASIGIKTVEIKPETALVDSEISSEVGKALGVDKQIKVDSDKDILIHLYGNQIAVKIEGAEKAKEQLQKSLREVFTKGAEEAAAGIGEAVGTTLAAVFQGGGIGNALEAGAEALLKVVGGVLKQVGKEIILASTLIQALKKALATAFANPVFAIGVGVALVAAGALLSSIKFNIPKFADGGIASGPKSGYLAMLHGNELVVPLDKAKGAIGSTSGHGDIILLPSLYFSPRGLQVMLQRADNTKRRLG